MKYTKLIQKFGHDILSSDSIQIEKKAIQHGNISVYDHTIAVARMCLYINDLFHLKLDEETLVRGALLHDFFLYDWHDKESWHRFHGFRHSYFALKNAKKQFPINEKCEDMIVKHMFPLNPFPPKYKESWVLCLADKICASKETIGRA